MTFFKHENKRIDPFQIVQELIKLYKIDTVYSDLYIQRARELLSQGFPYNRYRELVQQKTLIADLPRKLEAAVEKEEWHEVKALSTYMKTVQKTVNEQKSLIEMGQAIYDVHKIQLDPFSPGMSAMTGTPPEALLKLRDSTIKHLKDLEREELPWRDFYQRRRIAFQSLSLPDSADTRKEGAPSQETIHQEALDALKNGNLELLAEMAESMLQKKTNKNDAPSKEKSPMEFERSERRFPFSKETLSKANRLGLTAVRVEAAATYRVSYQHAWHPVYGEEPQKQWGATKLIHMTPPERTSEALKNRAEHYASHPFINSGGARYLPDFVAEDLLVEDFPDPGKGETQGDSPLLAELGLKQRRRVSRAQIEHSLFQYGSQILQDGLGLDPQVFRLVCIPPDLFLRLGESRGWGKQEIWTHFDGYKVMRDGRLVALAGGDVRFGGIYDLVSIGNDYESEHVITRFAVIQRAHMATW
jgi:hypothetical protein